MGYRTLEQLRTMVGEVNGQLLKLISDRAALVKEVGEVEERQGVPKFDPARDSCEC